MSRYWLFLYVLFNACQQQNQKAVTTGGDQRGDIEVPTRAPSNEARAA